MSLWVHDYVPEKIIIPTKTGVNYAKKHIFSLKYQSSSHFFPQSTQFNLHYNEEQSNDKFFSVFQMPNPIMLFQSLLWLLHIQMGHVNFAHIPHYLI